MDKTFIVANFKSNMTLVEAKEWLEKISNLIHSAGLEQTSNLNKEIIVCPPFTLLSLFKEYIDEKKLPIKLGAQNISPFEEGAYTGEVNGKQIKEFADYVLIGHSERLTNFSENKTMIQRKISMCLQYDLTPILCVQGQDVKIPSGIKFIVYEPIFAIGTGNPDTPDNADNIAVLLKSKSESIVLYGGSINSQNVKDFTNKKNINGVLVGGASLEASEFAKVIENA